MRSEVKWGQMRSSEVKCQISSNNMKWGQVRSTEVKWGQLRSNEVNKGKINKNVTVFVTESVTFECDCECVMTWYLQLIGVFLCIRYASRMQSSFCWMLSWRHISRKTIRVRALKFLQNVDLIRTLVWKKFSDLDLDTNIDIDIDRSWYLHIYQYWC